MALHKRARLAALRARLNRVRTVWELCAVQSGFETVLGDLGPWDDLYELGVDVDWLLQHVPVDSHGS